jgi:hypothetical protein
MPPTILILSLSKDELQQGIGWISSFDRLRMRIVDVANRLDCFADLAMTTVQQKRAAGAALLSEWMTSMRPGMGTSAPDVDRGKQEEPDHIDEVPVPGGELEAEMLLGCEVVEVGAVETDR